MKTRALSFITVLCAFQVFSVQAETVSEALNKCRNTDNSLKRLVCYDRVAKSLDQYQGANEDIGTIQPFPVVRQQGAGNAPTMSPRRDAASEFGLENKKKETHVLEELALTITDISDSLRGKKVVTFSDGSVWQQTDNNYLKIEVGQTVTIERGVLGAFFLSVEGLNKRMKVKRLK
ncbi:hypothetical protein D210916BOD24_01710 [Alteromonas sp. D210916BOD_24]|uniref:hypothetical protein n=1 Tax=Alteromonas sp. D210916BOD_24 TaxID=3157618 RepID=UPI00399C8544